MTEESTSKTPFDGDLTPDNPQNIRAARERDLYYNPRSRCYEDGDGCKILDKFGQPF